MLHQPTIEKLLTMRMEPLVEAWRAFEQDENAQQLSFEEKLSLMVDRLWTWRQNQALARRLRYAKLRGNACVEGHRLPHCPRTGSQPDALLGPRLRMGGTARAHFYPRALRDRQELLGVCSGSQSLPGRLHGLVCPGLSSVSGSGHCSR
jgi:hypothetical protein